MQSIRIDVSRDGALADDGHTLLDRLTGADAARELCVDGLSTVVRTHGTEAAFRVLVALQTVVHDRPVRVHVHLDPDGVDARTVRTLANPLDLVVRIDGDEPILIRGDAGDPLT